MLPEQTIGSQAPQGIQSPQGIPPWIEAQDGTLIQTSHITAVYLAANADDRHRVVAQTPATGYTDDALEGTGGITLLSEATEDEANAFMDELARVFGTLRIEPDTPTPGEEDDKQ